MDFRITLAQTSGQVATSALKDSWAWYLIRASGLVALGLLVYLMLSGIGHVTGWTYRFIEPVKAWALHKAAGIALLAAVLIHMFLLLIDKYVTFTIPDLFVPFLRDYSNKVPLLGVNMSRVAVALGVLAMYGSFAVVISSIDTVGWIRSHKKLWKTLHVVSYVVMLLVVLHALSAGTDFSESFWRAALTVFGFILALAGIVRLSRNKFFK